VVVYLIGVPFNAFNALNRTLTKSNIEHKTVKGLYEYTLIIKPRQSSTES